MKPHSTSGTGRQVRLLGLVLVAILTVALAPALWAVATGRESSQAPNCHDGWSAFIGAGWLPSLGVGFAFRIIIATTFMAAAIAAAVRFV